MAILPKPILDYTDKDFEAIRLRLRKLISSVFPTWTDDSVANFGNILVEAFAFTGDVLTFYQDNQAAEGRIPTATLRRSLLSLVKLLAYTPKGIGAATSTISIQLSAPVAAGATLTFKAGERVKTGDVSTPVFYQFLADLAIAAGQQSATATVENSAFANGVLTSNGLPNQSFSLPSTPYIDGSFSVTFADGTYTQVANFLASTPSSQNFVIGVDANNRATAFFGNGINGKIPIGSGSYTYKTGGGSGGRLQLNALSIFENPSRIDSLGNTYQASIASSTVSSGGTDPETIGQIKVNAPASLTVLKRCVARSDYEVAALAVPGVARALHITSNEVGGTPQNSGITFVVPVGGGVPTAALLAAVAAQTATTGPLPATNTYQVLTQAPNYLTVNVSATVYRRQGTTTTAARANIATALGNFFAIQNADGTPNTTIDFGYYLKDQDGNPTNVLDWGILFAAIEAAGGIRKLDAGASGLLLNGLRADVPLGITQFPVLGSIALIDGATGASF